MRESTASAAGGFIWWSCASWSSHDSLVDAFKAHHLEKFCPRPPSPAQALLEGMTEVCRQKDRIIRPLADEAGFCVVKEKRGTNANAYEQERTARLAPHVEGQKPTIFFNPLDEKAQAIVKAFNGYRTMVSATALGGALVNVAKHFSGTSMRKSGGIYWLPRLDKWRSFATAVEACAIHGASCLYLSTLHVDADSVRAVRDALASEIGAESERIMEEIKSHSLSDKALANRCEYLNVLQTKIAEYEEVLGESLTGLKDSLDRVQVALGVGSYLQLTPTE
jgi:hypothetical protein